jgi:hypothetical protein
MMIGLWLIFSACALLPAQTIGTLKAPPTPTTFWSQVNTYIGLTPDTTLMLLASGTPGKDGQTPTLVLGPTLSIAMLPFLSPRLITDAPERSKYLTFQVGYRYVKNLYGRAVAQNNGVLALTPRLPLPLGLQIADRNRIDLRGLSDRFSWNYRNRLTLARSFQAGGLAFTPYAQAEVFYNCEFGYWSQYNYSFGVISRLSAKVEVDTWYKRQITMANLPVSTNVAGVKLLLFFRNFLWK